MSFGLAVPRQNGKNEVVSIRELWGLLHGERILHTAHLTQTAHSAFVRLYNILSDAGYIDAGEKDKGIYKGYGKEHIYLDQYIPGAGRIEFRTRTSKGGLGESYDVLVIDEAQEYQSEQRAALQYVISASPNPQTIYTGTPPTPQSKGDVFQKYRKRCLAGEAKNSGWEDWGVDQMTDPDDREAWYESNPSLGIHQFERNIEQELSSDKVDFNVQRLGLWLSYSQQSAITKPEWMACKVDKLPELKGKLYVGIKYSPSGNVSMSIAVKTTDDRVFIECVDCRPMRATNRWILDFLRKADWSECVVDGASGQKLLQDGMKQNKLRRPILPTVADVIKSSEILTEAIANKQICHMDQPSVTDLVTNCEHRAIGTNGGYGFKSIYPERDVSIMDSIALALWAVAEDSQKRRKQVIRY